MSNRAILLPCGAGNKCAGHEILRWALPALALLGGLFVEHASRQNAVDRRRSALKHKVKPTSQGNFRVSFPETSTLEPLELLEPSVEWLKPHDSRQNTLRPCSPEQGLCGLLCTTRGWAVPGNVFTGMFAVTTCCKQSALEHC